MQFLHLRSILKGFDNISFINKTKKKKLLHVEGLMTVALNKQNAFKLYMKSCRRKIELFWLEKHEVL